MSKHSIIIAHTYSKSVQVHQLFVFHCFKLQFDRFSYKVEPRTLFVTDKGIHSTSLLKIMFVKTYTKPA